MMEKIISALLFVETKLFQPRAVNFFHALVIRDAMNVARRAA